MRSRALPSTWSCLRRDALDREGSHDRGYVGSDNHVRRHGPDGSLHPEDPWGSWLRRREALFSRSLKTQVVATRNNDWWGVDAVVDMELQEARTRMERDANDDEVTAVVMEVDERPGLR